MQAAAAAIVADVRAGGDGAVRAHTARLDRVHLPEDYAVPAGRCEARLAALSPELRAALETAAANIRAYHEREAAAPLARDARPGPVVGQEVVPLAAAGLYVPGGLADYPSSVLMTAIPAQVAGVGASWSARRRAPAAARPPASPPPAPCSASTDLYPIGGAQAVAAMAYGTASRAALRRDRRPRQRLRHRGQAPGDGRGGASTAWPARAKC